MNDYPSQSGGSGGLTVIILSVHICVHMHGRLAACISHGRRKHRRHTLFVEMAMRFPTRLTVFCCVGLAIVYSSAAIVHSHRSTQLPWDVLINVVCRARR